MSGVEYPPIDAVEVRVVRAALDAATSMRMLAPGAIEDDLHELTRLPQKGLTMHAIVENGRFMGCFSFQRRDGLTSEIGFWIRTSDRRRGLVRAAWDALRTDHGPVFVAECWADNASSRLALEAMGFQLQRMRDTLHGEVACYRCLRTVDRLLELTRHGIQDGSQSIRTRPFTI